MGAAFSFKKKDKPKRPRKFGKVHDYLLEPTRKRPRTSKSLRDAKFIATLGQQGRSATMFELNKEKEQSGVNLPTPRWQSKWEIDMRPKPGKELMNSLRTWKSMPLPTTERASAKSKAAPVNRPSHSRRSKKSRTRSRMFGRLSSGALPPVEEPDKYDLQSVASYKVDEFKMLQKTDAKTQSLLDLTAKLWHIEPKKHNKAWFLGPDNQHKLLQEPTVSFENMPKHTKPFTTYVNLGRAPARAEHSLTKHETPPATKHETIIEEE